MSKMRLTGVTQQSVRKERTFHINRQVTSGPWSRELTFSELLREVRLCLARWALILQFVSAKICFRVVHLLSQLGRRFL